MKIILKTPKPYPREARIQDVAWIRGLPFNVNPRGILTHRVRSARTHLRSGLHSHDTVDYWCGNGAAVDCVTLTDDPPENRLLCLRCEQAAVAAGEPTADELVGRHVHIGTLKAQRHCCRDGEN